MVRTNATTHDQAKLTVSSCFVFITALPFIWFLIIASPYTIVGVLLVAILWYRYGIIIMHKCKLDQLVFGMELIHGCDKNFLIWGAD